jgi:uncharacterized protein (DUF1697 family)
MPRKNVHIALLRGINVGKAKRIAMADLRDLVERLGYGDVRTLLNSGNVVFSAARGTPDQCAHRIENALATETGITSRIIGLSATELQDIIEANPFPAAVDTPSRFNVALLRDESVSTRIVPLSKQAWGSELLAVGKRAVYMWTPDGVLESKVIEAVGRAGGDAITVRTWSTLEKIAAAAGAIPA